jgi:hypothetical protein
MKRESPLYQARPHLFGLSRQAPDESALPERIKTPGSEPERITAEDVAEAEVDIYLDELEGLSLKIVEASAEPENDNLFGLMYDARRNAVHVFEADMLAGLKSLYGTSKRAFTGNIGGTGQSAGVMSTAEGQIMTLSMQPIHAPGVVMLIKRIGLLIDSDASVEVLVSGIESPVVVVASADTPSYYTFPEPVRVSLAELDALTASYSAAGFRPLNNSTSCGCTTNDALLAEYFAGALNEPANGILLDVSIVCDETGVLTANYDASIVMQDTFAYACRYKAGELLIEGIMSSTQINRYTMLDREHLWGKRNHYRSLYQDRINWLVGSDGVDTSYSSCFRCNSQKTASSGYGQILI